MNMQTPKGQLLQRNFSKSSDPRENRQVRSSQELSENILSVSHSVNACSCVACLTAKCNSLHAGLGEACRMPSKSCQQGSLGLSRTAGLPGTPGVMHSLQVPTQSGFSSAHTLHLVMTCRWRNWEEIFHFVTLRAMWICVCVHTHTLSLSHACVYILFAVLI